MILVSAYHSAGVILCHCMDQGPGGWDQAESEARGLMQAFCVIDKHRRADPLVSFTAAIEIQLGDAVRFEVKHC